MDFLRVGFRNSFEKILSNTSTCDVYYISVENNYKNEIVICGTKHRLKDFIYQKSSLRVIVDVKCAGTTASENIAQKVSHIIFRKQRHMWFLTSSNEYCVLSCRKSTD